MLSPFFLRRPQPPVSMHSAAPPQAKRKTIDSSNAKQHNAQGATANIHKLVRSHDRFLQNDLAAITPGNTDRSDIALTMAPLLRSQHPFTFNNGAVVIRMTTAV